MSVCYMLLRFADSLRRRSACKCPKGTKYDEPEHRRNKWFIALCCVCASHGCHRQCRSIAAKDCDSWMCDFCAGIMKPSERPAAGDSRANAPSATGAPPQTQAPTPSSVKASLNPNEGSVPAPNAAPRSPAAQSRSCVHKRPMAESASVNQEEHRRRKVREKHVVQVKEEPENIIDLTLDSD